MQLDRSKLDPELTPILERVPPELADITRDNIHMVREATGRPVEEDPSVSVARHQVPTADGEVLVYVYRKETGNLQPGLLWIHGGGYILGSAHDQRGYDIAAALGCTVVAVEYRLAPEHPFPAGSEDCYAALQWMVAQAGELQIDAERLAIGGASAGGGMAAGLALMNRDRGGPALALQLLLYPMVDNLHATPSGQYVDHPVWNRQTSFNAWEMYLGGTPGEDASPYAAAARATDLSGLPPAYVCVGSEDLFRDEDVDYARRLIAAGVPCELAVFPGLYHGGDNFVPQAAVCRRLVQSYQSALAHALGVELA